MNQGLFEELPTPARMIESFIAALPSVTLKQAEDTGEQCPICLQPFTGIQEITQLACGHVYCKNDVVSWVSGFRGTCPSCRFVVLDVNPPNDSDGESSDGGEYIPEEEDEEDDMMYEIEYEGTYADGIDGEEMEWSEDGLTDGESEGESDMVSVEGMEIVDDLDDPTKDTILPLGDKTEGK